jgi:hypothetical protein
MAGTPERRRSVGIRLRRPPGTAARRRRAGLSAPHRRGHHGRRGGARWPGAGAAGEGEQAGGGGWLRRQAGEQDADSAGGAAAGLRRGAQAGDRRAARAGGVAREGGVQVRRRRQGPCRAAPAAPGDGRGPAPALPLRPRLALVSRSPGVLVAIALLRTEPDLFIFDGQGIAHMRRLGLASHVHRHS